MQRASQVVRLAMPHPAGTMLLVKHHNLMTPLLKHFADLIRLRRMTGADRSEVVAAGSKPRRFELSGMDLRSPIACRHAGVWPGAFAG
jgi:hypothetical protein